MVPGGWNFFSTGAFATLGYLSDGSGGPHCGLSRGEGLSVSTSQAVAQHLPYLRRYARALTGNQSSGDAYVAATLEALIEDPAVLESSSSTRIGLYRLFTKNWNSVGINGAPDPVGDELPVEQRLAQMTPKPRQAFLLVALEGLSED